MSLAQARRDNAMTAPPLRDSGRPLEAATRSSFESGFGQDFSRVRVHDDAHAHDSARALNARAYAAGDHLVFGAGQYRPDTPSGQALLAHELAHSVQQTGLAMKADGPLPAGADARLEAEADRAAIDVLSGRGVSALSRAAQPAVFRVDANTTSPAAPAGGVALPARPANIPEGFSIDSAAPPVPNAPEVTIWLDLFTLPKPKGAGPWVQQAYDDATAGKRLGTILMIDGGSFAAWKEDSKTDEYRNQWLHRHGFKTFAGLATTITAATTDKKKPLDAHADIKALLPKLGGGLSSIKCDIDHIVEKQMGGTSQPSNLQLLTSDVNQASGREAYARLKGHAQTFIAHSTDWTNVKRIAMRIRAAKVEATPDDVSFKLEKLLRDNPQLGNAKIAAAEDRKPLYLSAGGVGETIGVKEKGDTDVDEAGVRIVPGVKLAFYKRGATKTLPDMVIGELDHRAMTKSGTKEKDKGVAFHAQPASGPPAAAAAPDAAGGASAQGAETGAPAGAEQRQLTLDKNKFKALAFYYPYLSPGMIKTVDLDAKGGLTGTGTITPSIKFLGELSIAFGPDELKLVKKLDVDALNGSAMMKPLKSVFRFTDSSLDLDLMKFVPSGNLAFTMGPAAKPLLSGNVTAKVEGGAFVATGKLKPGEIPGISAAEGDVTYSSKTGWSGSVMATSATLPGASKIDVVVGFREGANGIEFYGAGGLSTKVRDSILTLKAAWKGGAIGYRGSVHVPNPLPLVDAVDLTGSYEDQVLTLGGVVKGFTWKNKFQGDLTVKYVQKDGEAGKFSGSVVAKTIGDTAKMDGQIKLTLREDGKVSGKGEVAYQVTKEIRPKLGVELIADPTYRLRLFGEVTIAAIPLTGEWPKKGGERKEIIKGLGVKINIPTPVPGLTAYFSATGSFGVTYGIGPLALNNVKFNGELYPLEEDPKVKASLTGRLSAPGFAGIYGTFGARLGAEVLAGALGLNGGIDVTPSLTLKIDAGVDVNASYSADKGFAFSTEAGIKTRLEAQIAFDLKASIYAAYGAIEYTWTHPLNDPKPKQLGPEFIVTLGRLSYSKDQGIVWPSLDQIDYSPKDFDPKSIITDLLSETKPEKK
jgi:Domain of unknown function (DUF4157)